MHGSQVAPAVAAVVAGRPQEQSVPQEHDGQMQAAFGQAYPSRLVV